MRCTDNTHKLTLPPPPHTYAVGSSPQVLQRRYLDNVPSIVPLLEREYRHAAARLEATRAELGDLQHDKLKVGVRLFEHIT